MLIASHWQPRDGHAKGIVSADMLSARHAEGLNDACPLWKTEIAGFDSVALRTAPDPVRASVHNLWACTGKIEGLVKVQCTII